MSVPTVKAIIDYWDDDPRMNNVPFIVDCCWGCGAFTGPGSDGRHRAHIQARSAGGLDTPENLHLLCPVCHARTELLDGAAYWAWFNRVRAAERFRNVAVPLHLR